MAGMAHGHSHDHHHDHDPDHSEIGPMDLRVRALETVLAAKGYIDPAALDVLIDTYQTRIGPRNGARVVARSCLLYTSDAADERSSVDLGGRRILKKKKQIDHQDRRTTTEQRHQRPQSHR